MGIMRKNFERTPTTRSNYAEIVDRCDCVHSGWLLQRQNGVTTIRTGLSYKRPHEDL